MDMLWERRMEGRKRKKERRRKRKKKTYPDILRQHLIRHLVLVHDIVVQGAARSHCAEEEAEESVEREGGVLVGGFVGS
jgi:predicted amidophosphoribosyltransferase